MSCIDCGGHVSPGFQRCVTCHRTRVHRPNGQHTFSDLDKEARIAARLGVTFYRTPLGGVPERVA